MRHGEMRNYRIAALWAAACALASLPGAQATAQARCADHSFPIYFARESAELSPASKTVLQAAERRSRACRIDAATIVGRGDAAGPGKGDVSLAERRAEAVATHLSSSGVPRSVVRIIAKPAQASARPVLERRATVHIELSAKR